MNVRVVPYRRLSTEELMLLNHGVGENSLESLRLQRDQTNHSKGNQSWIFTGRTNAKAEAPNTLVTWCEELTHWWRPWCWERLKAEGEGDDRGWDDWMASPTQWTWVWEAPGDGNGEGSLVCCSSWGQKELDKAKRLSWTELKQGPTVQIKNY